uniref:ScMYB60 protein n=1 Tax=Saccharum hybrid cultivar Co 86032 TaxID=672234 RepID=A0A0C6WCQ3_9POAL|nr:ScMYB60 protein [Saccharum hybrid cultivar Co 86032]
MHRVAFCTSSLLALGVGSMPLLLPVNVSVEVGDSRSIFAPCHACSTSRHGEAAEAGTFVGCACRAVGVGVAVRIFDSRASRASASRRALSHCAMWLRLAAALADLLFVVPVRVPLIDLWVTGSIPILASLFLRCVFQCSISLSVRFGRCVAMADHLNSAMNKPMIYSSCFHLPCMPKFYVLREGEMRWQIKKYKHHAITSDMQQDKLMPLICPHSENCPKKTFIMWINYTWTILL